MTLSVDLKTIPRHKEPCTLTVHYTHHATLMQGIAYLCKETKNHTHSQRQPHFYANPTARQDHM